MKDIEIYNMEKYRKNSAGDDRKNKFDVIYKFLIMGLDYNKIIEQCPEITEEELNWILYYFACKGLRYIPTLS